MESAVAANGRRGPMIQSQVFDSGHHNPTTERIGDKVRYRNSSHHIDYTMINKCSEYGSESAVEVSGLIATRDSENPKSNPEHVEPSAKNLTPETYRRCAHEYKNAILAVA
jgi:hypothetical protein